MIVGYLKLILEDRVLKKDTSMELFNWETLEKDAMEWKCSV